MSKVMSSEGKELIRVSTVCRESLSFLHSSSIPRDRELAMVTELEMGEGKSLSLFGDGSRLLEGVLITGILKVLFRKLGSLE